MSSLTAIIGRAFQGITHSEHTDSNGALPVAANNGPPKQRLKVYPQHEESKKALQKSMAMNHAKIDRAVSSRTTIDGQFSPKSRINLELHALLPILQSINDDAERLEPHWDGKEQAQKLIRDAKDRKLPIPAPTLPPDMHIDNQSNLLGVMWAIKGTIGGNKVFVDMCKDMPGKPDPGHFLRHGLDGKSLARTVDTIDEMSGDLESAELLKGANSVFNAYARTAKSLAE